jgi:glycosyltransferase involved in cell wall biosynthesis
MLIAIDKVNQLSIINYQLSIILFMKVLHLLDSVNRGGAETIALDVCRNAKKYGIDLTVVVTNGGELENDFKNSGAKFIRLERKLPIDVKLISRLRKIIREQNIEIVQGYQAVEALHLHLATVGLNVKKVLSFQGFIPGKKNQITAKYLIPRMDANILVSRGFEEWLKDEFNLKNTRNFHLIYNGADTERLTPSGKSIKKELGLDENISLLGMVANFPPDSTKDQLTICRALPKVFAEKDNIHFIFVGKVANGGEENFEKCVEFCKQNKIADRVHFLGGRRDIPDILDALDIFVFSSRYEGLPIAVTEAMLVGVPIIVSDIEPLLEVSDNGNCAEVFPVGNAEILSEKILKLLNDKNLRADLAKRAEKFAKENFSIEAHMRELKKLYEFLVSSKQ